MSHNEFLTPCKNCHRLESVAPALNKYTTVTFNFCEGCTQDDNYDPIFANAMKILGMADQEEIKLPIWWDFPGQQSLVLDVIGWGLQINNGQIIDIPKETAAIIFHGLLAKEELK